MKAYYAGYCGAIYVGFVVVVVIGSSGHPDPLLFALLFLTLWPLVIMLMGYEGVMHVGHEYEKRHGAPPPRAWERAAIDGVLCGVIVWTVSALAFLMPNVGLWFLAVPLAMAYLAPGIGLSISLRRTGQADARGEEGASGEGDQSP